MILKGNKRGDGAQLAEYLMARGENDESPELLEISGTVETEDIGLAMAELEARGLGCRALTTLFHCTQSPAPGEPVSDDQRKRYWDIFEAAHGLRGHPYIEVRHAKLGPTGLREEHYHRVYSLVTAKGRLVSTYRSKIKDEVASRQVEFEGGLRFTPMIESAGGRRLDHTKAVCRFAKDRGMVELATWVSQQALVHKVRGEALTLAEQQQQKRTKVDRDEVRAAITAIWRAHAAEGMAGGDGFRRGLEEAGLMLARADRGNVVAVDRGGGVHSLVRVVACQRLGEVIGQQLGSRAAQQSVDMLMAGIDAASLPTIAEVRVGLRQADAAEWARAAVLDAGTAPAVAPTMKKADVDPLDALFRMKATFTMEELREACLKTTKGDQAEGEEIFREQLASTELITIAIASDGTRRLTTAVTIEAERRINAAVDVLVEKKRGGISRAEIDAGLERFQVRKGAEAAAAGKAAWVLNAEQRAMVLAVLGGRGLNVVVGVAGAGKTAAIECALEIAKTWGYRVEGISPSNKAAAELRAVGITEATTCHRWISRFDRQQAFARAQATGNLSPSFVDGLGKVHTVRSALSDYADYHIAHATQRRQVKALQRWSAIKGEFDGGVYGVETKAWLAERFAQETSGMTDTNTIVVMDEAGMAGHTLTAEVMDRVVKAGAALKQVGDDQQIQAVAAGGSMSMVIQRLRTRHAEVADAQAVVLDKVNRQRVAWQRQATVDFASGDSERAAAAVRAYVDHSHVHAGIRGYDLSPATLRAEAEAALAVLGKTVDIGEDQMPVLVGVARYAAATHEAAAFWREIKAGSKEVERPADHPLFDHWREAVAARQEAALALMPAVDQGGAQVWIARYGVDGRSLIADALVAHPEATELSRSFREEIVSEQVADYGLGAESLAGLRDCWIRLDSRAGARAALLADWRESIVEHQAASYIIVAYTNADVHRLNAAARQGWREAGRLEGAGALIGLRPGL